MPKARLQSNWCLLNSPWSNLPKGWGIQTLIITMSGRKYGWLGIGLATGQGNPPVVRVRNGKTVWFGLRPVQKPDLLWLGGVVKRTGHRTVGLWLGWNCTADWTFRFLQLWQQLSFLVLIISWHNEYADCAALIALSPSAFRFAIRLIIVKWFWNMGKYFKKFAGFRSRLHTYWLDHKSESGRWKSG